ncbi:hypothetical protein B0H13DRAFT_1929915 [Mycena leptocephala]|nr:hypothetical protein B0H13DRAFT_1929915 [Mycena leptocephala]
MSWFNIWGRSADYRFEAESGIGQFKGLYWWLQKQVIGKDDAKELLSEYAARQVIRERETVPESPKRVHRAVDGAREQQEGQKPSAEPRGGNGGVARRGWRIGAPRKEGCTGCWRAAGARGQKRRPCAAGRAGLQRQRWREPTGKEPWKPSLMRAKQHGVLTGGGKRRGAQGGNGGVRGAASGITSQERQEAMCNQSLKVFTRCAGPPAWLESGHERRKAARGRGRNGGVPGSKGRGTTPRRAGGNRRQVFEDIYNAPLVALGAGGRQEAAGAWEREKRRAVRRAGLQRQRVRETFGIGVILDVYDAPLVALGAGGRREEAEPRGWERRAGLRRQGGREPMGEGS